MGGVFDFIYLMRETRLREARWSVRGHTALSPFSCTSPEYCLLGPWVLLCWGGEMLTVMTLPLPSGGLALAALLGLVLWLALDTSQRPEQLVSFGGICVFIGLLFTLSKHARSECLVVRPRGLQPLLSNIRSLPCFTEWLTPPPESHTWAKGSLLEVIQCRGYPAVRCPAPLLLGGGKCLEGVGSE